MTAQKASAPAASNAAVVPRVRTGQYVSGGRTPAYMPVSMSAVATASTVASQRSPPLKSSRPTDHRARWARISENTSVMAGGLAGRSAAFEPISTGP
jgi:hypothetical protein